MKLLYLGPEDSVGHVAYELGGSWDVAHALDDESVDSLLPECDAVLDAYMRVRFPAGRLQGAGRLRLFVTATTGADHVDEGHLSERGIPLLTLRGQRETLKNITPAAELSWLLLMACARQLRGALQDVQDGVWDRNRWPGTMLRGRTLGVIGCGRIGEWMSRYAQAFGMECLGFDPHIGQFPATIRPAVLDDLLRSSDFVSIHVPLNDETRGLVGRRELSLMKPGSVLVNTSRGEIVDQDALVEALESGHLAGAGLDVLTGEPDIEDHPLVRCSSRHHNVIITPHIGGFSPDALKYVLSFSCGRILRFFEAGHAG